MTRIATPENETCLLTVARHGTAHRIEQMVRNYRRCQRLKLLQEKRNPVGAAARWRLLPLSAGKEYRVGGLVQLLRALFSDNMDLIILPKRLSLARFSARVALLNACSRISF
jgi:hypothetical protein